MNNNNDLKSDFCIEIDFEKGTESPSRIFRTMTELIETFQSIDNDLIKSIHEKIEPVVVIEDIQTGSLKTWLASRIKDVEDQAIKNLDWKQIVGKYLVSSKYIILNFIEGKTEISNRDQIEKLEKETNIKHIPFYQPVRPRKLLTNMEKLSSALSHLSDKDKATYKTSENDVVMNTKFSIVPEKIEELLIHQTMTSTMSMILKVKKPDYLGESRWEFRHENKTIHAKILDMDWLKDFQSRNHDVRPGDSLRTKVEINIHYDHENEVVGTQYDIVEIIGISRPPEQQSFDNSNK